MSEMRKLVVFKINEDEFAADIMQVERILGYVEPTKIPEAPYFVKGVIKYENKILPIIDLKNRLNINNTKTNSEPKIIVVKQNDKNIGLIVDLVSEVIDIKQENIETAPEIVQGISNKYITGIVKIDDRIIVLINTERIVSNDDIEALNSLA